MGKREFSIIVSLAILAIILSILSIITTTTNTNFLKSLTGHVTEGNITANMDSIMVFEISPDSINFGNITQGGSNDTISNGIAPFIINNTGNAKLDMTITSANALLTGTSPTYAFNSSCYETSCAGTVYSNWANFTQSAQDLVKILEFDNSKDALRIDLMIGVPLDEPAGAKTDTLTFTASEAAPPYEGLPYIYFGGSRLYIYPNDSSASSEWGCSGTSIPTAQSNINGSANTIAIVGGCATEGIAAKLCSDLNSEGYDDWYLPSKLQLNETYVQRNNVTAGGYTFTAFVADRYLSSTESSAIPDSFAWYVNFNTGLVNFHGKDVGTHVRCVRSEAG